MRTQEIADSLDLGMELTPDLSSGSGQDVERRETVAEVGEPNRIISKGDGRLEFRNGKTATVGRGLHGGKRRVSVG